MIKLPKLILASSSPRRAEILKAVGWEYEKQTADIDETELPDESPEDYVRRLAREKAGAVAGKYTNALVLGADTIVVIENKIVGKPKNLADARRMLKMLSGNWHEVLTGVALVWSEPPAAAGGLADLGFGIADLGFQNEDQRPKTEDRKTSPKSAIGLQKTRVKFARLSDAEIEFLIERGEPLDKAGAYAVQAQAALFIEQIEGDYWNVVGLPVNLVYELSKTF